MLNLQKLVDVNPQWNALSIFQVGQALKNKPVIQSVVHSVMVVGDHIHAQRILHAQRIPIVVAKNVTDYIVNTFTLITV